MRPIEPQPGPAPGASAQPRKTSAGRRLLFIFAPVVALLVALELGGRALYFQKKAPRGSAIVYGIERVAKARDARKGRAIAEDLRPDILAARSGEPGGREGETRASSTGPTREGSTASNELSKADVHDLYEEIFIALAELCRSRGILLWVVHAPDPWTKQEDRTFFADLTARHGVGMTDLSDRFGEFDRESVYLLPLDPHLSAFGGKLLAERVASDLEPHLSHRAPERAAAGVERIGDLNPAAPRLREGKIPYFCTVTPEGLRLVRGVEDPSAPPSASKLPDQTESDRRPRVLCVGDSYTFGHYVSDEVTYPSRLQALMGEAEVLNAGVPGYTICDEYDYLAKRGLDARPDIVILQVLNNDLYGLQPRWRTQFCRHKNVNTAGERGRFCIED